MALRDFFDFLSECTTYLDSNSEQLFSLSSVSKGFTTNYNRQKSYHVQGLSQL